jgi:hypothetical protein
MHCVQPERVFKTRGGSNDRDLLTTLKAFCTVSCDKACRSNFSVEDTIANENPASRGFLPVKSERVPERLWTSRQEASRPSEIKGTCLTLND